MSLGAPKRKVSRKIPQIVKGNEHAIFAALLKQSGIPQPTTELRFAPPRRWRFDYAWRLPRFLNPRDASDRRIEGYHCVALEVEGGAFSRGRHTRGVGFLNDCEKYSEAAALGWRIIRVPPSDLCSERTVDWIRRALSLT